MTYQFTAKSITLQDVNIILQSILSTSSRIHKWNSTCMYCVLSSAFSGSDFNIGVGEKTYGLRQRHITMPRPTLRCPNATRTSTMYRKLFHLYMYMWVQKAVFYKFNVKIVWLEKLSVSGEKEIKAQTIEMNEDSYVVGGCLWLSYYYLSDYCVT